MLPYKKEYMMKLAKEFLNAAIGTLKNAWSDLNIGIKANPNPLTRTTLDLFKYGVVLLPLGAALVAGNQEAREFFSQRTEGLAAGPLLFAAVFELAALINLNEERARVFKVRKEMEAEEELINTFE